jgi:dTDP-glucose pyrophosphorylase
LRPHVEKSHLDAAIKKYTNNKAHIIVVDKTTRGQACTVLLAEELIDNRQPLLIHNVDTFFECDLSTLASTHIEGAIPFFESDDPSLSFIRMGGSNLIEEVAEKRPISSFATLGLYYFSHGSDFVWAAKQMIRNKVTVNGEFYVAPAYNELIRSGARIIGVPARTVWDLGTPEKIERFEQSCSSGVDVHSALDRKRS